MAQRYEWKSNADKLTDTEINEVIRYLDPDLRTANEKKDYGVGVAICLILMILVFAGVGFIWLCP